MKMLNVVYIVTEGEYSDFHIEMVFDNLDDAKRYYDIVREREYSCPSIEVYNVGWQSKPEDMKIYYTCYDEKRNTWFSIESNETDIRESHDKRYHRYYVAAKDNAHAMKIAYDRHAAWKAMQEGIA